MNSILGNKIGTRKTKKKKTKAKSMGICFGSRNLKKKEKNKISYLKKLTNRKTYIKIKDINNTKC